MSNENDQQLLVLAEVSHDLANRFHRSYYFLDLLDHALGEHREEADPLLARLRETIEDVELLARSTLGYLRPLELRTLRVRVADLISSLRQHLGMRTLDLRGDQAAGAREVEVDPARISEALASLCKLAIPESDIAQTVVVDLIDGDPVCLRIHRAAGAPPLSPGDLTLATTSRIVHLHGGGLEVDQGETSSLTLCLPVAVKRD